MMIRVLLLTLACLFISKQKVISQNRQLADSLISVATNGTLNDKELFELWRKIAHSHPDYSLALQYAHKALQLSISMNDPLLEAQAYEEISSIERLLGNNINAMSSTLNAVKIYDQIGNEVLKAATYVQLGSVMTGDKEYSEAITYFQHALRIYHTDKNQLLNYTFTLVNLGEAFRLIEQYDSAIHCFKQALEMNVSLQNKIIQGYSLGNLGMTYASLETFEEATDYLTEAVNLLKTLGDAYSTSIYIAELGSIAHRQGKLNKAEQFLLQSLGIANKEGLKEQIRDFSLKLVNLYADQGDYKKALFHQKTYQNYQDSLVNKDNIKKIERIQASYEIDKRETEIALLNSINTNQKTIGAALGFGILIVSFFTFMLYRSNQIKKKNNLELAHQKDIISKREEEKALLLRELNHRVKNNLQMVSSLLSLQGANLVGHPAAEALSDGQHRVEALSLIHQKLYREDINTRLNFKEYIKDLTLNLCYSYDASFEPIFEMDDCMFDIDTAVPLALIVNELVTNSLKYAFIDVKTPKLTLRTEFKENTFTLMILDNGCGIKPSSADDQSFGLRMVHSLTEQLNGSAEVISKGRSGTHWTIKIPKLTNS